MKDFIDRNVDDLHRNTNSGGDMGEFRVRKTDDRKGWCVADNNLFVFTKNYVDETGRAGSLCLRYSTQDKAQTALDLYLSKQEQKGQPERKLKIGDKVKIIGNVELLHNCGIGSDKIGKISVITGHGCDDYCGSPYSYLVDGFYFPEAALELVELPMENTKPTNPKDALAINKAPLSTLPTGPMYEVALAMLEGARKYGRHNYRIMGIKASVYYDAVMGHITAWWEGEDTDPASGIHHLGKAMACLAVIRDGQMMENWVDDRPPKYPCGEKLMRNNPAVKVILDKYPDCVEPYTEINKNEKNKYR